VRAFCPTDLLAVLAAAFALGRFTLVTHVTPSVGGSYQAFAHLFVGGLVGAYLASRKRDYLWLALALSAVELFAFLVTR